MKIEINFELKDKDYSQYERILQDFLNNMNNIGYPNIDIMEINEDWEELPF